MNPARSFDPALASGTWSHYWVYVVGPIAGEATGCCSSTAACDPVTGNLYSAAETADLPDQAVLASLGCGNPTSLIDLKAGETVLDLGSGGGSISCSRPAVSAQPGLSTAST